MPVITGRCVPCDKVYGFSNMRQRGAYCPACGSKLHPTNLPVEIEAEALTRNGALTLIVKQNEILRRIAPIGGRR